MRDRRDPWRWPFSIGLAVALFMAGIFLTPQSWIDFFLASDHFSRLDAGPPVRAWLEILPPPELSIAPDVPSVRDTKPEPPPQRPSAADARWWTEAWRTRTIEAVSGDTRPAPPDSVMIFLDLLDLSSANLTRANADSVVASRLWLMQLEDSFRFDELKPYLGAMTRSRAYADIMSRAADMYGDFLQSEIMVPD